MSHGTTTTHKYPGKYSIKCGCSGELWSGKTDKYTDPFVADGKVYKSRCYPTLIIDEKCHSHKNHSNTWGSFLLGFGCGCIAQINFDSYTTGSGDCKMDEYSFNQSKCKTFPCERHYEGKSGPFCMYDKVVTGGFVRSDPPPVLGGSCGCMFDPNTATFNPCVAHRDKFKDVKFTKV